jgi:hypothetical protein
MLHGEANSVTSTPPDESPALQAGRSPRAKWLTGLGSLIVFGVLAVYVLVSQNHFVGFEPGYDELQPRHHGWVSSHALAIISHATAENGFVGYALAYAEPDGTIRYDYFDRYPVFFSAGMHQALAITERLSSKVYIAKQIMNLIYLATLLIAALIVDKLIGSKPAALAAAVLAMSSEYLLFYKDMIHFDQPALLGFMFLTYTIALCVIDGRRQAPLLGAIVGVSLGRGYASIAVLGVWFVLEWALAFVAGRKCWRRVAREMVAHPATKSLVLGVTLAAVLLLYNASIESWRTGVSFFGTSIFESAEDRLGLDPAFNLRNAAVAAWPRFLVDQLDRLIRWSLPLRKPGGWLWGNVAISGVMLVVIAFASARWDRARRVLVVVALASPIVWLTGMRYMSAPHDYTSMYYMGVPLLFYASAFSLLKVTRRPLLAWSVLAIALVLFHVSNQHTQTLHAELETRSDPVGRLSQFTWDMMAIREVLPGDGTVVALSQEFPNAPYGFGFYLPEYALGSMDLADYIITRNPEALPGNLTPENKRLFVFPNRAEP